MLRIKNTNTILCAILLLLSTLTIHNSAEAKRLYTHSTIDQLSGLSNNKITAIAKDPFGFYWVGTRRGLNCIINGRVEQFTENTPFNNHEIKFITVDNDSRLWVATDADLFLFDYKNQQFNKVASSNYASANGICSSHIGTLICRRDAIELYDEASASPTKLDIKGGEGLEYSAFASIDPTTLLLICSQGREIYLLDLETLTIDLYEDIELPIQSTNYRDRYFLDSRSRLWVSIYNHSLVRYSLEGEGIKEAEFSTAKSNLGHDIILSMIEVDGELIVATDGGGINSIDLKTDQSRRSTRLFNYQELPLSGSINALYYDPADGLFTGTIRNGLACTYNTDIQAFNFRTRGREGRFNHIPGAETNTILAFCEDANTIYLASDGAGVWGYNTYDQKLSQIESTAGLKVTDLSNISREELLIAIHSKGIYRLNKRSGALKKVTIIDPAHDKQVADKDMVISFGDLYQSKVMIMADHIYQYDLNSGRVALLKDSNNFATGNLFFADQNTTHNFFHNQYGVYKINKSKGDCQQIYNSITGGITSVRSSGNILWIIRNHSLYSYNIKEQKEELVIAEASRQALSIEKDQRGHLWLTTFNRIIAIDINNPEQYISFARPMGYVYDDYQHRSTLCSRSGDLYFGGNNGFISVSNNINISPEEVQPIELLTIKVDGQIQHARIKDGQPTISIPWDYSTIEIETYIKNRNIYHVNKFQYTIHSDGKSSIIESDNKFSLQMIRSGNHDINVAYLNNNGEWCSSTRLLTIAITPPWWGSTLFRMALFIAVILAIITAIGLYHREQQRRLIQLHLEREQELASNKIKYLINISHELRTPLTLIYSPLKRLLEKGEAQGELKGSLVRIFGQTRYMAELINMVLDARRMEAGHGRIEIAEHPFNTWVENIIAEFADESCERNIKLTAKLDPSIESLNFDAPKCRTVLSNLLMNSLRYSRTDGTGEVIVTTENINGSMRLSVIDNGIGLAGVNIDNIFTRFVRINNHTTGSGIGLSYSKAIIEQHKGGVIGAFSNNLQGATFFFEIPLGLTCQNETFEAKPYLLNMLDLEEKSNTMTDEDYPLHQHTILFVDDQEDLQHFIVETLTPLFKKVYTAHNGAEAYKLIKEHMPSVVVSDIMMPEMDGYELCTTIKNDIEVSHTPIILLSAKSDPDSRMLGYKSGADAYISKPFDVQHMLSLIASQLRARDISRRRYSQFSTIAKAEEITYSNADEQFMLKLNLFIEENLSNNIDVEIIATHMCMSRAALYKKLKTIIDIGAMEYVTKIRMTTAAEKLRSTQSPITEIAMQCGYTDNQYFSKAFKQFHGVSPSQYRKSPI